MKAISAYIFISILLAFFISCNDKVNFTSPPNYDLNHPGVIYLNSDLSEISGIIYYPKDTSIFAISDASGSLYKIFPDRNTLVQKWKFGTNHDYEDLQRIDSTFYILSSSGNITAVKFSKDTSMQVSDFKIHDKQKNEFETLYFDSSLNKLVLICKDCEEDDKSTVSTRSFDITDSTYADGPYTINVKNIDKLINTKDMKFKPSAAAINPVTHELFILASVNKLLVIADKNGNAKKAYFLHPSLYKQPEGIAFTPSGDLLISNEAGSKQGDADILVIKRKK
ncbi:MAG TPA: SdiA-regulated domain-containing protein [Parafilimonas sp.]|nr:SdiA-regulated domain-containing protein [Parafilimonas sp.]